MPKKLVFLKTDEDFSQFRRSKMFSSKNIKLRVRFNTNQNTPRFGFIIPKKIVSKVTDRNKLKRRIKTILQKYLQPIKGADFLWFPAKSALKLGFTDLESEILTLIKSSRLWK